MANEPHQRLLDEFERTAHTIADAGVDPASWAGLRYEVVDMIDRGNRALARGGTRNDVDWSEIRWDESDAPVVLARAFGVVHRRLADWSGGPGRTQGGPPRRAVRAIHIDEPMVIDFSRLVHITHMAAMAG